MNCVRGLVHEFPERDHAEFATDCQVAFPEASDVRIYPDTAPDDIRRP